MRDTIHRFELRARVAVSVVVSLLMLGVGLPNTDRAWLDAATTPPTPHIEKDVVAVVWVLGIALIPLGCVLVGLRCSQRLEIIGWVLYGALAASAILL